MHCIIIITGSPSQNHKDNFLQVPYFSYCFIIFNIILHGKLNFTANLFLNIRIFNLYLTKPILFCLTDTEHCSKNCPSQVFLYFNVCTYNVISKINAKKCKLITGYQHDTLEFQCYPLTATNKHSRNMTQEKLHSNSTQRQDIFTKKSFVDRVNEVLKGNIFFPRLQTI